jgi:hypothetical protein
MVNSQPGTGPAPCVPEPTASKTAATAHNGGYRVARPGLKARADLGLVFRSRVAKCLHEVADGGHGGGYLFSGHPGAGAGRHAQAGVGGQLADLDLGNPLADDGGVCPGVECHPVLSRFLIARPDFSLRLTSSRGMASSWLAARASIATIYGIRPVIRGEEAGSKWRLHHCPGHGQAGMLVA